MWRSRRIFRFFLEFHSQGYCHILFLILITDFCFLKGHIFLYAATSQLLREKGGGQRGFWEQGTFIKHPLPSSISLLYNVQCIYILASPVSSKKQRNITEGTFIKHPLTSSVSLLFIWVFHLLYCQNCSSFTTAILDIARKHIWYMLNSVPMRDVPSTCVRKTRSMSDTLDRSALLLNKSSSTLT